jgi:hypothetical protein
MDRTSPGAYRSSPPDTLVEGAVEPAEAARPWCESCPIRRIAGARSIFRRSGLSIVRGSLRASAARQCDSRSCARGSAGLSRVASLGELDGREAVEHVGADEVRIAQLMRRLGSVRDAGSALGLTRRQAEEALRALAAEHTAASPVEPSSARSMTSRSLSAPSSFPTRLVGDTAGRVSRSCIVRPAAKMTLTATPSTRQGHGDLRSR